MNTTSQLFNLKGRVAIVTGATGLLGTQHCHALAEAGANIVVVGTDYKKCRGMAVELREKYGVRILPLAKDVSVRKSVEEMVERTCKEFNRIDILVNNAALTVRGGTEKFAGYFAPFEEYPLDLWEKAVKVNITSMFLCSQAAGKVMVKQKKGVIINISSIYGVVAPDQRIYEDVYAPYDKAVRMNTPVSYSVTKGAVLSLTRYLASYWAGKNIRVNALTPGGVYDGHSDIFVKQYSSRAILGRMANRDEYKGAILFLASDASSYMTGANLVVDGGWTVW